MGYVATFDRINEKAANLVAKINVNIENSVLAIRISNVICIVAVFILNALATGFYFIFLFVSLNLRISFTTRWKNYRTTLGYLSK